MLVGSQFGELPDWIRWILPDEIAEGKLEALFRDLKSDKKKELTSREMEERARFESRQQWVRRSTKTTTS